MFGLLRDLFVGVLLLGVLATTPWLVERFAEHQAASDVPETVRVPLREPYFDFTVSRFNEKFAVVGLNGRVNVGRLENPAFDLELNLPDRQVTTLRFSPQEPSLLLGCQDGTVLWQSLESLKEPRTLLTCRESISAVNISPDGRLAAIASHPFEDQPAEIAIVELRSGIVRSRMPTAKMVTWFNFTPDNKRLLGRDGDGAVLILDASTGKLLETLEFPRIGAGPAALSANGQWLAIGGLWGDVALMSMNDRRIRAVWPVGGLCISTLSFSPNASLLACGTEDRLVLMHCRNHSIVAEQPSGVHRVYFTARGKKLLSSSHDGTIRRWSVPNLKEERRIVSELLDSSI